MCSAHSNNTVVIVFLYVHLIMHVTQLWYTNFTTPIYILQLTVDNEIILSILLTSCLLSIFLVRYALTLAITLPFKPNHLYSEPRSDLSCDFWDAGLCGYRNRHNGPVQWMRSCDIRVFGEFQLCCYTCTFLSI